MISRAAVVSLVVLAATVATDAFAPTPRQGPHASKRTFSPLASASDSDSSASDANDAAAWNGDVVSNDPKGRIQGCQLTRVGESPTDWEVTIDGEEADLGKFSEAVCKASALPGISTGYHPSPSHSYLHFL